MLNTVNYMIAGYVVIAVLLAGYLVSLGIRWRKLKEEEQALEN